MRYVFGFLCVCALGVMPLVGCSETTGDGGSGGDAGSGGTAGDGGSGGMPECQSPEDCDDRNDCTENACADGMCEYTPLADGTACDESNECTTGMCASGECGTALVQDGAACGDDAGSCQDGSCQVACAEQGIRDAIAAGGGPFTFDCDGPTIVTISEPLWIEEDLILDGAGNLTLQGGRLIGTARVSLELHGLAFSNLEGPITVAEASLTIVDSQITDSAASAITGLFCASGCGSGQPGLTMRNTLISGARTPFAAIQVFGWGGTIEHSTIEGNLGTAVSNGDPSIGCQQLTIRDTTISGNGGYGLSVCGDVTVSNSTLSGNLGEWAVSTYGDIKIANSTVSGNVRIWGSSGAVAEFRGVLMQGSCSVEDLAELTSLGYNIESPGDTCGFDPDGTDLVNVTEEQLNVGPLQDNGGPTMTRALLTEPEASVAIDRIPAEKCEVDTDQRGEPRPETGGDACDVGAFERQPDDQ